LAKPLAFSMNGGARANSTTGQPPDRVGKSRSDQRAPIAGDGTATLFETELRRRATELPRG
jgi:hypothetical protein